MTSAATRQWPIIALAFALLMVLAAPISLSQEALSQESVQQQLTLVANDASLSEQLREKATAELNLALETLQREADFQAETAKIQQAIDDSPQRIEEFGERLHQAQQKPVDLDELSNLKADPELIKSKLAILAAEKKALSERRTLLLAGMDAQAARRDSIQGRLIALKGEISDSSSSSAAAGDTQAQSSSKILGTAQHQALLAEQQKLETEILAEPSQRRNSAAERVWINFALEENNLEIQALNSALEEAQFIATQERLAKTAALEEKIDYKGDNLPLETFADQNRLLAQQIQDTAKKSDTAREDGRKIQQILTVIEQDSHLMKRRLEVGGRKEVLGRVMITRLESLPKTDRIKRDISGRNQQISETSLIQIDAEEELRALSEHQTYFSKLIPDFDSLDEATQKLVGGLAAQRSQLLEDNIRGADNLLSELLDNNDSAVALIRSTNEFHKFLVGNLLWVRNFSFLELDGLYHQLSALFSPKNWSELPAKTLTGLRSHNLAAVQLLLLLIVILLHWQLRKPYERLMSRPTPRSSETLWNITLGMGLSLILVLPWPLALYLVGYFLDATPSPNTFTDSISQALMLTARPLYLLLLTRLLANRMGVGRRFLKWNPWILDAVRKELNWAGPVIVIAFLVDEFSYHHNVIASGGAVGAIANATVALSIIVFCMRLLRQSFFSKGSTLRHMVRAAAALGALVIIMQFIGLLFASKIFLLALIRTIAVLLTLKTLSDILERWLLILRARLERRCRQEQQLIPTDDEALAEDSDDLLDVLSLSEAHAKLLGLIRLVATVLVLWFIWSPSLPALNLLDGITLWEVTDANNPGAGMRAITLFDVSLGVLALVMTGLITKHLPSLSEVFMREWFNMTAGARYASGILMQYLVIAIGGTVFLSLVGWEWDKVQWLIAALGVGIGFGLQEIVANFICGIIILFERPVRVGDIISAGGAEGVVRRINPRATVIETFDHKEHLIPNKELITGQVINWSLTENAVRVVIPVGVAYGSDVRQALALLLEVAKEVDLVLEEPAPTATFEDFGDSSLLLWLRCHVSENRPKAWTELRICINEKFEQAGISIAFPQRDVHLDIMSPLRVEIAEPGTA